MSSPIVERLTFEDEKGKRFWGAKIENPNSEDLIRGFCKIYEGLLERIKGDPPVPENVYHMMADMRPMDFGPNSSSVYFVYDPFEAAGTRLRIIRQDWV